MDINLSSTDLDKIRKNTNMAKMLKIEFVNGMIENMPYIDSWTIYEMWLLQYLTSANSVKLDKWIWIPRIRTIIGNVDHSKSVLFPTLSVIFSKASRSLTYMYVGPQLDLDKASSWIYSRCNRQEYEKILPYLSNEDLKTIDILDEEYSFNCNTYILTPNVILTNVIYPTSTKTLDDVNQAIKYNYKVLNETDDPIIFDTIVKIQQDLINKGETIISIANLQPVADPTTIVDTAVVDPATSSTTSTTSDPSTTSTSSTSESPLVTEASAAEFEKLKNSADTEITDLPTEHKNYTNMILVILVILVCLSFLALKLRKSKKVTLIYPKNEKLEHLTNTKIPEHKLEKILNM